MKERPRHQQIENQTSAKSIAGLLVLLILFLCLSSPVFSQQYGLGFAGNEAISDKRTSLALGQTKQICTSNSFRITFDLKLIPIEANYFGYLLRMVDDKGQNIDLIYSEGEFELIIAEKNLHLNFAFDEVNRKDNWYTFNFVYDATKSSAELSINDKLVAKSSSIVKLNSCFTLYFGRSLHPGLGNKDVMSMFVKDVKVYSNEKLEHHWPLNESEGNVASDKVANLNGTTINPKWLRARIDTWEPILNTTLEGVLTASYQKETNEIRIFSPKHYYNLNLLTQLFSEQEYKGLGASIAFGDEGLFFPFLKEYGVLRLNEHLLFRFDEGLKNFKPLIPETDSLTEYWHHNTFIYPQDSAVVAIGGYGMYKYKNSFQKYSLLKNEWTNLSLSGDMPSPRYLAGFGNGPADSMSSYYMGGYGSSSGDQLITPRNYYDLYKIDWKNNSIKRLYTLPDNEDAFVYGSDLIISPDEDYYYGLIFNQLKHNSKVQLIKGSLEKPEYANISAAVPFLFNDVRSTVHLYHNELEEKLYMVLTYHDIEKDQTNIKVYHISTPKFTESSDTNTSSYLPIILIILAVLVIGAILLKRRNKKESIKENTNLTPEPEEVNNIEEMPIKASEPQKGQITLFGEFHVINKKGHDITGSFTPLLKEIFLYILINSLRWDKGLSSAKLDEMFWYDKTKASARNNRSVNIIKLKGVLAEIEGVSLVKNAGSWEIKYEPEELCIDYAEYLKLVLRNEKLTKDEIDHLTKIVQKGTLLPNQDFEWLESFKSETSNKIIDAYLLYAESIEIDKNTANDLIDISNKIFLFDPVEEMAMAIKCKAQHLLGKHSLSKKTYQLFTENYESLFAEKFPKSFQDVLEN